LHLAQLLQAALPGGGEASKQLPRGRELILSQPPSVGKSGIFSTTTDAKGMCPRATTISINTKSDTNFDSNCVV
jgi:hypothetical protein